MYIVSEYAHARAMHRQTLYVCIPQAHGPTSRKVCLYRQAAKPTHVYAHATHNKKTITLSPRSIISRSISKRLFCAPQFDIIDITGALAVFWWKGKN